jgi:hypothetical protein
MSLIDAATDPSSRGRRGARTERLTKEIIMKRLILTSAVALSLAAPAFASDALSRVMAIEPGTFTTAELATIKGLREAGDTDTADALAALYAQGGVVSTQSVAGSASAQLAANLGLDPEAFTTAELATIKGIREGGTSVDRATADGLATAPAGVVSTQSAEDTRARAQLARFLGVDPADYSMAELAQMKGAFEP